MQAAILLVPFLVLQGGAAKLQTKMVKPGKGYAVKAGDKVTVHYIGKLKNGTKFDSSRDPGRTPFEFVVGSGQVIKGWDQGLVGKKAGSRFLLTIPPKLAYGDRDLGVIPPNSTLVFDIEVLKIAKKGTF